MATRALPLSAMTAPPPTDAYSNYASVSIEGAPTPEWNRLIELYSHRVIVALVARGITVELARDVTHDAWIRLMRQHRSGRLTRLELPGLAITQALFLARDARRTSRRRETNIGLAEASSALNSTCFDPTGQLLARDQLRRITCIVERSSSTAQRVFEMSYGPTPSSPTQIAETIGISVQRVRQVACELRTRIRLALGDPP